MRLYVGWFWLKLGLDKFYAGWLSGESQFLPDELNRLAAPHWFDVAFVDAARSHVFLFQWLVVVFEVLFGALLMAGAVARVAGIVLAAMAAVWFIATGYDAHAWMIPMALMSLTLAAAAAGRYLGVDAILRARLVKVPLF